mgnify:FL=1
MLKDLKKAAKNSGFTLHIATSDRNIKDQLNTIVRTEDLPMALSSWDLDVNLEFNEFGELNNPTTQVTMLLIDKADSLQKKDLEDRAEDMGQLFIQYVRNLKAYLTANTNVKENPITGASFTYVPKFGGGQHSGVLGKFNVQMNIEDYCDVAPETEKPVIISGPYGISLIENSGAGQVVYTIVATDNVGISSYQITGTDAGLLTLTGNIVTLDADPDYETKFSYSFGVTATDEAGNVSDIQNVTFSIEVIPLLDTYTNSSVAYSLRKLSSSTTSVVRVRRDSDDVEQDFTAEHITDGTLTTFTGVGSGFVSIIYDQSGNDNHGVQTNTLSQPKIVDSGSLILENGQASMLVNEVNDGGFNLTNAITNSTVYTFTILNPLVDTKWAIFADTSAPGGAVTPLAELGSNSPLSYKYITNSMYVNDSIVGLTRGEAYNATTNIQSIITMSVNTNLNPINSIFFRNEFELGGHLQEMILFESNEATNKTAIELDMNTHYTIY